jgi:hypothetical protein
MSRKMLGEVAEPVEVAITRIYAIRNPRKLARLDEQATLSR